MNSHMTRREFGATAGAFLLSTKVVAQTEAALLSRPIPGSGERIPAVGLGTAYVFDVNNDVTRSKADAVIQALVKSGGRLIDTASTYGDAESVLGEVTAAADLRDKLFIATKLEAPNAQELKRSLVRLKTAGVDLLQLHNVSSRQQSLERFREWKKQGVCRYVGITSTFRRDYHAVDAGAMQGPLPDPDQRRRMIQFVEAL
jgi:aryl-alcohol dehydrogenase-like predicted oxidoreductase